MGSMQVQKLELLEWLAALQDKAVIGELMKWKEAHERTSLEQYNRDLEDANKRIDSGQFIAHEDVEKESQNWLK